LDLIFVLVKSVMKVKIVELVYEDLVANTELAKMLLSAIVMQDGMEHNVNILCVMDAIMDIVFHLVIAIVFMDGKGIIALHVNLYLDVRMEDAVINPLLVNVNMDGKAYFVMSLFAILPVFMELVHILMTKLEISAFVRTAGKD